MSILEEQERRERAAAEERRQQRIAARQFREDVQAIMAMPGGRRVVGEFLQAAGADLSAYRDGATPMAHAVGWQDAGRWWLAAIREHCPEREPQMRAEANKAREGATDEADDADR